MPIVESYLISTNCYWQILLIVPQEF
uniref:Uncharacterized protein n=1 Tax=Rhizophora mucronata TaxID=61149 RepID=A0A2P2P9T1_RHIMU